MKPDKRLTPARADLAAAHLRGQVTAAQFVDGTLLDVRDGAAALRRAPRPDGAQDSELLFGESFTVYETDEDGWCWGQSSRDSYVGYVARNALQPAEPKTHRIAALGSFLYPGPSIKLPPIAALSLNALLTVERQVGDFLIIKTGAVSGLLMPCRWMFMRRILFVWPNSFCMCHMCGAGARAWGWIVPALCSWPCRPAGRPRRATATCSRTHWAHR